MKNDYLESRMLPILKELEKRIVTDRFNIESFKFIECSYHGWDLIHEDSEDWADEYRRGDVWGGVDYHCWFRQKITVSSALAGKHLVCRVRTGKTDIWNYDNPQFLAYLDVPMKCGLYVNHS